MLEYIAIDPEHLELMLMSVFMVILQLVKLKFNKSLNRLRLDLDLKGLVKLRNGGVQMYKESISGKGQKQKRQR